MNAHPGNRIGDRAGMTLIEMTVAVVVLGIVMLAVYNASIQTARYFSTGETENTLQHYARVSMKRMVEEIRNSGNVFHPAAPNNVTLSYPFRWSGNNPPWPYGHLVLDADETPVQHITDPNDPASGPSWSVVYKVPVTASTNPADVNSVWADNDGDGTLDEPLPLQWVPSPPDANGQLPAGGELDVLWGGRVRPGQRPNGLVTDGRSAMETMICLVRDPGGDDYNVLQRRLYDNGALVGTETLCRYVERVVFDYYRSGGVEERSDLLIRLFMRRRNDGGHWIQADLSAFVVGMRTR